METSVVAGHEFYYQNLVERLPEYARVLELGSVDGRLARSIQESACISLVGIGEIPRLDEKTEALYEIVLSQDLSRIDALAVMDGEFFDVVVLMGALEQLRRPETLLREILPLLMSHSRVLVSVQNIAHHAIRSRLLRGAIDDQSSKQLSRQYFHYFTLRGITELFESAGLAVLELDYIYQEPEAMQVRNNLARMGVNIDDSRIDQLLEVDALGYQYIVELAAAKYVSKTRQKNTIHSLALQEV